MVTKGHTVNITSSVSRLYMEGRFVVSLVTLKSNHLLALLYNIVAPLFQSGALVFDPFQPFVERRFKLSMLYIILPVTRQFFKTYKLYFRVTISAHLHLSVNV